jgi:hypothetical protein
MSHQLTVADAASRYAAAGWAVHPLHDTAAGHCSCTDGPDCGQRGKHPRTAHGFHDATRDPNTVYVWWRRWPRANIGVPTGATARLAVVDLDGATGAAAWDALAAEHGDVVTAVAHTPHGRHHWYHLPSDLAVPRSIRGLGAGIDVLGDDGYAIAPPSTITGCPKPHERGDRCETGYTWTSTTRHLAPLPAWIPRRLEERARIAEHWTQDGNAKRRTARTRRPPRTSPPRVRQPRRYALAALRGEADRVATAAAGQRNDTLNYAAWRLAGHLRDGTLTEPEIRDALVRGADACGLTTDDGARAVQTTITSALRSGGRSR